IPNDMFNTDPDSVEWKRLAAKVAQLAEKEIQTSTKHKLYPGCIVRIRAVTRFDKVISNSNDTPFSERRWRVVGFPTGRGLITHADDYGYFRKVKLVSDGEIKVLHASRLCICTSAETDVADLRRAMRRIGRQNPLRDHGLSRRRVRERRTDRNRSKFLSTARGVEPAKVTAEWVQG
ncbi:hypothetical protein Pmar_PMAR024436, partial [Perkinsus marinus ATCC 50983]